MPKPRRRSGDAEQDRLVAHSHVERCRDDVREAHDLGADPAKATAALDQAKHDAEQAELAAEGVSQRVRRLTAERQTFVAAKVDRLLEELQPVCDEAVEAIRNSADALLNAHTRWHQVAGHVAAYLRGMSLSPAENQPGEHGLEPVIRDLKRANEVTSPAPHMHKRAATQEEQTRVAQLLRERTELEAA